MTAVADAIVVRLVDTWDRDEIVHLYHAGGWWKEDYDPAAIPDLIRKSFAFAVAIDRTTGQAVGMGRVISDGISDGYVQDLVVLPAYRKLGIGKEIVSTLVRRCTESGVTWIGLVAEPDTEEFYRPLGFHRMQGYVPLLYNGGQ